MTLGAGFAAGGFTTGGVTAGAGDTARGPPVTVGDVVASGVFTGRRAASEVAAAGTGPEESLHRGEFHIFAVSRNPVTLDVKDAHGNASALRSPWAQLLTRLAEGANLDSRVLQVNNLHDASVRVVGKGCALVMVLEKH